MASISNNLIIVLNRGDSLQVPLFINCGAGLLTVRNTLGENDKVYLGVMSANKRFEEAIIKKVYTIDDVNEDGDVVIKLEPKDTEYVLSGTYYYEIKLQQFDDNGKEYVYTIVPRTKFIIIE